MVGTIQDDDVDTHTHVFENFEQNLDLPLTRDNLEEVYLWEGWPSWAIRSPRAFKKVTRLLRNWYWQLGIGSASGLCCKLSSSVVCSLGG